MITFAPLQREMGHLTWLKTHVKCVICEDTKGIVALRDGVIVAMMIADSWTENSCQVHNAVTDPLVFKHGLHVEFAEYVFGFAKRKMMLGLVPSNNEKAIKIDLHYGFQEIARIPNAISDGVDYIVMQMTADECPYYQEKAHAA